MRITNNMIRMNSMSNINNNKINTNDAQERLTTGKKISRPSDDPVVAVRSLRLRSTIAQLEQYSEKNAKDAASWMEITADSLENISSVINDCIQQANRGANKDLTSDDLQTIVTQLKSLGEEYFALGNTNYAGRYIFSGFRTDIPLTYSENSVKTYKNIEDVFSKTSVKQTSRLLNSYKMVNGENLGDESVEYATVNTIRLSYDNLNYHEGQTNTPSMIWHENFSTDAVSISNSWRNSYKVEFTSQSGKSQQVNVPQLYKGQTITYQNEDMNYTFSCDEDGKINVNFNDGIEYFNFQIDEEGNETYKSSNLASLSFDTRSSMGSSIYFADSEGSHSLNVPLINTNTQYIILTDGTAYKVQVNSDNTYKIYKDNDDGSQNIINLDKNGIVTSSYKESIINFDRDKIIYSTTPESTIDNIYKNIGDNEFYFNAATGEVLFGKNIAQRMLSSRIDDNVTFIYDKNNFKEGDVIPEQLFKCDYIDETGKTLRYNKGNTEQNIEYNLGYNQKITINTKPEEVFSTELSRDIDDLDKKIKQLKQIEEVINQTKISGDEKKLAQAKKTWDYLREDIQEGFENKITSFTKLFNKTNVALTDNGSRQKRLELISDRLTNQIDNFSELLSNNEDVDMAEAITQLSAAQVAYEASLQAASKLAQTSLINYI